MATKSQHDWTVERMGRNGNFVTMEVREGRSCEKVVRFTNDGETITLRIDDEEAEVVGDHGRTEWVDAAAERMGVSVRWSQ